MLRLSSLNSANLKILAFSSVKKTINQNSSSSFIRHARTSARTKVISPSASGQRIGSQAINGGRIVLGGACVAGIGAMCFYGLGLSNEVGAIDTARFWPAETRQKIKSTYLYFAGSLGITATSAYYCNRSQAVLRMLSGNQLMVFGGSLLALIGSSIACHSMEYKPGLNGKHFAWAVHSGIVGLVIAPLLMLSGPLVVRAATYTAGAVGGLSLTAACAPDGKFLSWSGPLSLALGGICIASIGGMFLPATSAAMPLIYSISTYGGLVVFGGFMLNDTQKIIQRAHASTNQGLKYDPINASMGIYMDTINIFIRIVMILIGDKRRR